MIGKQLQYLMVDEANFVQKSFRELPDEIAFFDKLDLLWLDVLNHPSPLRPGQTSHYVLSSLARTHIIKAALAVLRNQISDGFTASRLACDAAIYSALIAQGRLTEENYKSDLKARNSAMRLLGQDINEGRSVSDVVRALHSIRAMHSSHAHADPIALAGRLSIADGKVAWRTFQELEDISDLKYFFMGMIWVGGACLRSYLDILSDNFKDEVTPWVAQLWELKAALQAHKRAVGIFSELPDSEGF